MSRIKYQFKLSGQLFISKILSIKMATLFLLLGFIYHIFLSPIKNFSTSVNYPISPWVFPFLLSDVYFIVLFMSAVVYFYSDVPFMKEWTMYQMIRTGRVRWAIAQIEVIFISAFAFIVIAFISSSLILFPNITLEEGWGKVLYTLSMTNAAGDYSIPFGISYNIISGYTVQEAVGVTIIFGGIIIAFLGMLMFAVSLYASRLWANIIAMILVILPIVVENVGDIFPWLIYFSPISWMRVSEMMFNSKRMSMMGTGYMLLLALICFVLAIMIVFKIRKVDVKLIKED